METKHHILHTYCAKS